VTAGVTQRVAMNGSASATISLVLLTVAGIEALWSP
jgi:hypothetical protein